VYVSVNASYAASRRAKHARFAAAFSARTHHHLRAGVRAWMAAAADISAERVGAALVAHEARARRMFACVARCAHRWRENARRAAERRGSRIGSGLSVGGGSGSSALLAFARPTATGSVSRRHLSAVPLALAQPSGPSAAGFLPPSSLSSAQESARLASSAVAADAHDAGNDLTNENAAEAVVKGRPLSSVRVLEEWEAMRAARDERRQRSGAPQTQPLVRAQMQQPPLPPQQLLPYQSEHWNPSECVDSTLAAAAASSSAALPVPLQATVPSCQRDASLLPSSPPLLLPPPPPSELTLLESRASRLLARKLQRAELAAHAARLADAQADAEAAIAAAHANTVSTLSGASCSDDVSARARDHADASSVENRNSVNAASTSTSSASSLHIPALPLLARLRIEVAAQRAAVEERLRAMDARRDDEAREARAIGDGAFAIARRSAAAAAAAVV
jgi:hypothetical protein